MLQRIEKIANADSQDDSRSFATPCYPASLGGNGTRRTQWQRSEEMTISSTLIHRAEIRFHEAAVPLRPFVGCFWVMTAERDATIRVVPDGSSAISIELQNNQPGEWFLRGPLVRPDERRFTSPAILIGIRLRPGVAFLLSEIPAHTIVGCRIGLSEAAAFHDLVSDKPRPDTPEQCIDVLERFLLQRLERASLHDVVATALREIEREHGCLRVPDIAGRCRVSSRHLHRLMRVWVGYGPKSYANIIRFQATLHEMEDTPGPTAAALAADNGYFDQAHLTLDAVRFAAATPGQLASVGVSDFSKTRCSDLP
jgi:AraC-like DNA-binding protein